jgi:hypothetical protein
MCVRSIEERLGFGVWCLHLAFGVICLAFGVICLELNYFSKLNFLQ